MATDEEWAATMKAENSTVYNAMKDSGVPESFSAALDKPEWLQVLIAWGHHTYNDEHMNFIIQERKFRSESTPSDEYVIAMHVEFIAVNSTQEINISHDLRDFYRRVIVDGARDGSKTIGEMAADSHLAVRNLFKEASEVVVGRMAAPWNRLVVIANSVRNGDYED